MAAKDGPRTRLIAEFDRLREYEQTAAQSLAEARASLVTAHEQDVREVAKAVRDGNPDPDVGTNEERAHADAARLGTITEGIALALAQVEAEVSTAVQHELGYEPRETSPGVKADRMPEVDPTRPNARPAGEVLWSKYEEIVSGILSRRQAGQDRKEALRRYDAAIEQINDAKAEHQRKGLDLRTFDAADYVDPQTIEDANPPGTAGLPRQLAAAGTVGY